MCIMLELTAHLQILFKYTHHVEIACDKTGKECDPLTPAPFRHVFSFFVHTLHIHQSMISLKMIPGMIYYKFHIRRISRFIGIANRVGLQFLKPKLSDQEVSISRDQQRIVNQNKAFSVMDVNSVGMFCLFTFCLYGTLVYFLTKRGFK